MINLSVFLLSLASLSFEVLLTRFYSITQWHHLSFMVISIALFGIAASGILLNLLARSTKKKDTLFPGKVSLADPELRENTVSICVSLFSLSMLLAFFIVNRLPLDYFRLAVKPAHFFYLALSFLLLSLPFFFSGLVAALAYSFLPNQSGRIYLASMIGSGAGALLPLLLIRPIGLGRAILCTALLPVVCVLLFRLRQKKRNLLSILTTIFAVCMFFLPGLYRINPSPYKSLSHYKQFSGTQITESVDTIRGRMDRVKSPYIRFAPGLSLKFRGILPEQEAIMNDGDAPYVLYSENPGTNGGRDYGFPPYSLAYGGTVLCPEAEKALIIPRGGGTSLVYALHAGIEEICLVEEQPYLAQAIEKHYSTENLTIINQNPRIFLARSQDEFDIIWIDSWGSSLPGMESLSQEYLFTFEAFQGYLSRLSSSGILVIARRLLMPPSDSLRLVMTAIDALSAQHPDRPEDHIAMIRNYDSYSLFVSRAPLSGARIQLLANFVRKMNFDFIYYPGIKREDVNRYNVLEAPYYFESVISLFEDETGEFVGEYPLDIRPQTDDIPFPNRFLRWGKLGELLRNIGGGFYSLLLTGEMLTVMLLAAALIISALLLFLPVMLTAGKPPPILIYFLCIGGGFMFLEIGYIQEYTFLLGDPVLSFSFVLASLLLFSGIGGYLSDRLPIKKLKFFLAALVLLAAASRWALPLAAHSLLSASYFLRIRISLFLLIPPALLLGFPFPMAIRHLLESPTRRAYAWAANGSASVLISILAVQISLGLGISRLFLFGALCYLLALLSLQIFGRKGRLG